MVSTIAISIILVAVVSLIVYKQYKDHKRRKVFGCGSGCSCCPFSGSCHGKGQAKNG